MQYFVYLSSFLSVYRHGSMRQAAKSLSISQPAITRHLQVLENRLKKKLFVSHGRGVIATEFAHHLASDIEGPIDQLNQVVSLEGKKDTIAISLDHDLFQQLDKAFYASLKNCHIFFSNVAGDRVKMVAQGKVDFAISRNVYINKNTSLTELFNEKHILVGSPKWKVKIDKLNEKKENIDQYAKLNWIVSNEAQYFIERYCHIAFKQNLDISPSISNDTLIGVLDLILKDAGVSVLPLRLCKPYLEMNKLALIHKPKKYPSYKVHLIYNKDKLKHASYKKTLGALEKVFIKN